MGIPDGMQALSVMRFMAWCGHRVLSSGRAGRSRGRPHGGQHPEQRWPRGLGLPVPCLPANTPQSGGRAVVQACCQVGTPRCQSASWDQARTTEGFLWQPRVLRCFHQIHFSYKCEKKHLVLFNFPIKVI